METVTVPIPDVMQFILDKSKIFKEVRHFNLFEGKKTLSNKLNIGINRGFSKANYTYSLKKFEGDKWSKQITGLFPTNDPNLFYGDTENKSNLVIIRFSNNGKKLIVYFFRNFYTRHIADFLKIFKENY